MRLEMRSMPARPFPNCPVLDGRRLAVADYVEDLVAGFEEMHRLLRDRRDALLGALPAGALRAFRHAEGRHIHWRSDLYLQFLRAAVAPSIMRDDARRDELFARLAAGWADSPRAEVARRFIQAERASLEGGDIPLFRFVPANRHLRLPSGELLEDFFEVSGWDDTVRRLQSLDDADLAQQRKLIRAAVVGAGALEPARQPVEGEAHALDEARRLADLIWDARCAGRAIVGWIGAPDEQGGLDMLGHDLYAGTSGIAVFFAGLFAVGQRARDREAALAALGGGRLALHAAIPRLLGRGGLSGVLEAMLRVADLVGEPQLVDEALSAALRLTPPRLERDRAYDVIGGNAGLIPVLLALHRCVADPRLLELAHAAATWLVRRRQGRAWPTVDGKCLNGHAHGAAGIALALARAGQATGDAALLDAARAATGYENEQYIEGEGWPDLRGVDGLASRTSWCHGGPGIALARVASAAALSPEEVRGDVERGLLCALQTSDRLEAGSTGPRRPDTLCCGLAGQLDILLECGLKCERPDWVERARAACRHLRAPYQLYGSPSPRGVAQLPDESLHPGLYRGLAGIGYTLLRIEAPARLPSLLGPP
jgi:type 2 lantibiotic biosynthesis protein LanM